MHHTSILHRRAVILTGIRRERPALQRRDESTDFQNSGAGGPRLVGPGTTSMDDRGVYRAYYGKLSGEPHVYTFRADSDVDPVKLVVLVPDVANAKTDISIAMI